MVLQADIKFRRNLVVRMRGRLDQKGPRVQHPVSPLTAVKLSFTTLHQELGVVEPPPEGRERSSVRQDEHNSCVTILFIRLMRRSSKLGYLDAVYLPSTPCVPPGAPGWRCLISACRGVQLPEGTSRCKAQWSKVHVVDRGENTTPQRPFNRDAEHVLSIVTSNVSVSLFGMRLKQRLRTVSQRPATTRRANVCGTSDRSESLRSTIRRRLASLGRRYISTARNSGLESRPLSGYFLICCDIEI